MSSLAVSKNTPERLVLAAPSDKSALQPPSEFDTQVLSTQVLVGRRIGVNAILDDGGINYLTVRVYKLDTELERGKLELDLSKATAQERQVCQELISHALEQKHSSPREAEKIENKFLNDLDQLASNSESRIGIKYRNYRAIEASSKFPDSIEQQRAKISEVQDPVFLRDSHTGCYSAAYLNYSGSLEQLATTISGPKLMLFLDINNVGAGNRFGLRKEVDTFLYVDNLGKLVSNCFGGKSASARLGGDEFVLVIEDKGDQATNEEIKNFLAAWETLRADIFKADDARIEQAEKYSALRSEMKKLRSQYEKSIARTEKPEEEGYKSWLRSYAQSKFGWNGKEVENLNSGQFALNIAVQLIESNADSKPRLMTVSTSLPIRLGEMLTVNLIHAALRTAQREIEHSKLQGGITSYNAIDPDLSLVVRHAEARLEETVLRVEQAFNQYRELVSKADATYPRILFDLDLTDLRCAAFQDPNVNHDVQRFNLLKDCKIGEILNIQDQSNLAITFIDIPHYGVINHLSYERADELYAESAGIVLFEGKPILSIRLNGGGLMLVSEKALAADKIAEIQRKCDEYLTSNLAKETRAQIEINERNALSAYFNGEANLHTFGTVSIKQAEIEVTAQDTFEKLLRVIG